MAGRARMAAGAVAGGGWFLRPWVRGDCSGWRFRFRQLRLLLDLGGSSFFSAAAGAARYRRPRRARLAPVRGFAAAHQKDVAACSSDRRDRQERGHPVRDSRRSRAGGATRRCAAREAAPARAPTTAAPLRFRSSRLEAPACGAVFSSGRGNRVGVSLGEIGDAAWRSSGPATPAAPPRSAWRSCSSRSGLAVLASARSSTATSPAGASRPQGERSAELTTCARISPGTTPSKTSPAPPKLIDRPRKLDVRRETAHTPSMRPRFPASWKLQPPARPGETPVKSGRPWACCSIAGAMTTPSQVQAGPLIASAAWPRCIWRQAGARFEKLAASSGPASSPATSSLEMFLNEPARARLDIRHREHPRPGEANGKYFIARSHRRPASAPRQARPRAGGGPRFPEIVKIVSHGRSGSSLRARADRRGGKPLGWCTDISPDNVLVHRNAPRRW